MRRALTPWTARSLTVLLASLWIGWSVSAEPVPGGSPTPIELTVVGGPDLNPSGSGRASPVAVRIFDLTAVPPFESADFQALSERPAQEDLMLRPGDIQERNHTVPPQVTALGVTAAFRDIEHAVWRVTVPVAAGRRNFVLIHLDRSTIRSMPVDTSPRDAGRSP